MKEKNHNPRNVGLGAATALMILILLIMVAGKLVLNFDTAMLVMIVSLVTTGVYVFVFRFSWDWMFKEGVIPMVARASGAIMILLTVGPMIAIWMASGTVPYLISLGLSILRPDTFLISASVICAISSLLTGTSWGSVATFGVALMGVGYGLGISPAATAGAVVAGSYFGDKISPISDTTVLAAATAETPLMEHIKSMLWTTIPAFLTGLVVYYFVTGTTSTEMDMSRIHEIQQAIGATFTNLSPLSLLPAALLLVLACMGYPTIPVLWASMLSAIPLAMMQGNSIAAVVQIMASGPKIVTGVEVVDKLLSRGGLAFMSSSVTVIFFAYIFAGQLECTGTIRVISDNLRDRFIKSSVGRFVLSTSLTGIITALGTGNSYLSIIMPGTMYRELCDDLSVNRKVLSRTLEDSGTIVVPLVPWSAAGVYMASMLGVAVTDYLPWAVMCYASALFAWLYGFTGIGIYRNAAPKVE